MEKISNNPKEKMRINIDKRRICRNTTKIDF